MPICSYVISATDGQFDALCEELSATPGCEVYPSDGQELIALVTETADKQADKALYNQLRENDKINCVAMSFADVPEGEGA